MKTIALSLAIALLAAGPALAGTQQNKMKTCNAEASKKDLKGDERKTFMSECLSAAEPEKKELSSSQERMKTCNAEAKTKSLSGDARKTFMSDCLSGKDSAAAAPSQQDKMKTCNADAGAKALKGDERKKFMSECLSK